MPDVDTVITVPEAINLLDNVKTDEEKTAGQNISDFLYNQGMKIPDPMGDSPAISTCCPVAQWLRQTTNRHILVGVTTIFVFDKDPVIGEFPLPAEEYPIPPRIRDFILYLDFFTRNWEMEMEMETETDTE